jgi:uncharacterized protein involved in cysteine biosynthesis
MQGSEPIEARAPGLLRRFAAGAFHVPAAFVFLIRRPRLLAQALLPALVAVLLMGGGLMAGAFVLPWVGEFVAPQRSDTGVGGLLFTAALYVGLPVTGLLLGLALALVLAGPLLDRLSTAAATAEGASLEGAGTTLAWELRQNLRAALYFALRAPGIFLVTLIPIAGPILGTLWGAHALSIATTDTPLARAGLSFHERRLWHRRFRPESLGFGLLGFLSLFVPFANLLLAPALCVAATRLVLELRALEHQTADASPSRS